MTVVVLADANIQIPRTLRDYLVYTARSGAFRVHWSQSILEERPSELIRAHRLTVRNSPKPEAAILETLQNMVGKQPVDALRAILAGA